MSINRLDHYSIRTAKLDATETFYTEILGLEIGPRPSFPFPGIWLYQSGIAVVHVVGIDPNDPAGLAGYLGDRSPDATGGTGTIDHVAFLCSGIDAMRARFEAAAVTTRERQVPSLNLQQIFLEDPNGITIELNFPG